MRKTLQWMLVVLVAVSMAGPMLAQASPHETVTGTVAGKNITIEYGRPFMKGREIFGGLVPYGAVWRTGADQATTFTTDADLKLGGLSVPKGAYSLFTLPTEGGWTLILNKTVEQWGAFKYEESADLGRTPMKVSTADAAVEQFTITIEGGMLKLAWDKTVATVTIQ